MTTKELLDEALALPIETRALIADTMLRSLNTHEEEVEREWLDLAKKRKNELASGKVESIPVSDILSDLKDRLST